VQQLASMGLALSVLVAACALTTQPPPAGTRPFQAQVANMRPDPVVLTITTTAGVLPGAVQPSSLSAGSTTNVTFHVPLGGEWAIAINGQDQLGSDELNPNIGACTMGVELGADGSMGMGCLSVP
jgi:hypothetical protein